MPQPALLNTPRGVYRLSLVEAAASEGVWTLTVSAEHAGGLEKFALRCHIAEPLLQHAAIADAAAACARLAGWMEGQFEQIREAALKSIRSERRLAEIEFDQARPGPF
jgi:hypothetical protein